MSAFPSTPKSATTRKPTAAASTSPTLASSWWCGRNRLSRSRNRRNNAAAPGQAPARFPAASAFPEVSSAGAGDRVGGVSLLHRVLTYRTVLPPHTLVSQPGNRVHLRNQGVELFPLFEGEKKRERFAIGRDRSRKTVKGRGVLSRHGPFDMGVRGELENLPNG